MPPKVEAQAVLPAEEQIRQLERFALENEFTKKLEAAAPAIVARVLENHGIDAPEELTRTFFYWPNQRGAIRRITGSKVESSVGEFLTRLRTNIIFLENDLVGERISVICGYFHEMMHSLGKLVLTKTEDSEITQVGYYTHKEFETPEGTMVLKRGEFLEEAVVDYLAVEMTEEFLREEGIEISAGEITGLAGGEPYNFIQMALLSIIDENEDLFHLLLQARFHPEFTTALVQELRAAYGVGTANRLFNLPFNFPQIGMFVMALAKPHLFR